MAKVTKANYAAKLKAAILNAAITGKLTGGTTGWKTVKLGEICEKVGKKENQILEKEIIPEGDFAVVSQGKSLIDGYSNQEDKVIRILPCIMFGDHTKNVKYIDFPFIIGADGTKFFKPSNANVCDTKYLYYWVTFAATQIGDRGYGRHYGLLNKMPFPLPPLDVQREIVGKVEELMPLVEEYGRAEEARQKLDTEFPEKLRKSILDLAIHGKLVAQDPAEPPAAIGASVTTPPYALPPNWKWVKLGEVGKWKAGATPLRGNADYYEGGNIPWLKTGDLNDGIVVEVPECITQKAVEETSVVLNPIGSVLIAMYGATIGKVGMLGIEATTNQACCACQVNEKLVFNKYLFYFLLSQREAFRKAGMGGAQPNISKDKIVNTDFPLPPLGEQKRIVAKVEAMMKVLEGLSASV